MTKICSKCNEEKEISEFGKLKRSPDGYRQRCKVCRREDDKKYKEADRIWRQNNKDKKSISDKKYYEKNKEKILEYTKKWRKENKELNASFMKDWNEKNKDHVREYKKEWEKKRRNRNQSYKIHNRFSCLMRNHMKKYLAEGKGNSSWTESVDYTADDLIVHLGRNLFREDYEIDHIIPVSLYKFEEMGDGEFRKCWDLRNLRVVTKEENVKKSNDLDIKLIEEYNIFDLLPKDIKWI